MKFRFLLLVALAVFFGAGARAQDTLGSVGAGYIYQFSQGPGGGWTSTRGRYALPTYNINQDIGVFADFANFYNKGRNLHVQLFGAFHAFGNRSRFTPFVFIGPGHIRDSYAGTVSYSFAWCWGRGLNVRLTRWVTFQTIPVDYVMNTANGNPASNFGMRTGFALTLPKKGD